MNIIQNIVNEIKAFSAQFKSLKDRVTALENNSSGGSSNTSSEWTQAFYAIAKLANFKETPICTLPVTWQEVRIEFKLKNSAQPEFKLLYNDIKSKVRKAYTLGQSVGDVVIDTNGELKCFNVVEPNVTILGVFYK